MVAHRPLLQHQTAGPSAHDLVSSRPARDGGGCPLLQPRTVALVLFSGGTQEQNHRSISPTSPLVIQWPVGSISPRHPSSTRRCLLQVHLRLQVQHVRGGQMTWFGSLPSVLILIAHKGSSASLGCLFLMYALWLGILPSDMAWDVYFLCMSYVICVYWRSVYWSVHNLNAYLIYHIHINICSPSVYWSVHMSVFVCVVVCIVVGPAGVYTGEWRVCLCVCMCGWSAYWSMFVCAPHAYMCG